MSAPVDDLLRRKRVTTVTLTLLVATSLLLLFKGSANVESSRSVLGIGLLWLCAFPAWHYFATSARGIPYLPAMGALYFFSYGLPVFGSELRVNAFRPSDDEVELALVLAAGGMLLLLLAFYWTRPPKITPKVVLELDLAGNSTKLLVLTAVTLSVRIALTRLRLPLDIAQLGDFIGFLPVVLLGGLFLLRLRGELARWQSLGWIVLVGVVLLVDLSTGAIAQPAFTLASLFFVYVAERGRVPVFALLVIVVLFIPAMATKLEYRHVVSKRHVESTVERLSIFGELIAGVFAGDRMTYSDADNVTRTRIDHLSAFSFVIAKTPAVVPYWEGATYEHFLWSFVPRVLAPDKPEKTLGQAYGHRYGFISRWDHATSINLEQTVEMYANFGAVGVLVGMFLMGALYRTIYTALNHDHAGDGGVLIAASTFRVLLNIESDFSLVFGGIVQSAVLLYVVLWLIARRRR